MSIYMMSNSTDPLISAITDNPSNLSHHLFFNDEEIIEALTTPEYPWDNMHHRSFFILEGPVLLSDQFSVKTKDFIHGKVDWFKYPIPALNSFKEGNMANISPTIKINISTNLEVVEKIMLGASFSSKEVASYKSLFQEFYDIFACSYTEIPELDPSIVEHHIDTWPNVAPMHQKQWPIVPSKVVVVKAKIEKLRTVGFIYPIAYTTWVSNPVPMYKK